MSLRNRLHLVTIGLALLLTSAPALAQGMRGGANFERMDANSDGQLSRQEHDARCESVFSAMDADKSGDITEAEFMAVRMGPGPRAGTPGPRHAQRQEQKRERFKAMDSDGDGKVTKEQFLAFSNQAFGNADSDGSGTLSFEEFRQFHMNR